MASYYLQRKDPLKKAARALTSRQVAVSTALAVQEGACTKRTALPAQIKHTVVSRDQASCQFRLPTGKLCGAKQWVEIHHIQPVSEGGTNTPENLIHLCRSHHHAAHRFFEKQRA
jgi:predicted HNH restriction endonuclease